MKDEFTRRNNITGLSDAGELPLTSVENLTPTDIESYGNNAIAIVGMACRLPGDIKTPEQCWRALVDNHSLIHPISSERQKLCPPLSSRFLGEAGCINDIDCFDAAFFQLSPREAQWLEPQQRLMLEISWSALESAGISPKKESGKVNGVFIGITNSEYADLVKNYSPESVDAYFGTGNVNAMAAGRLAYFYDWRGPALSIDTACSSSLVAIHMACRSLLHHECNLAVAGGIHLLLDDKRFIAYRHAGMLSPTHRCKTFDDTADGYVRSEGGAVFVLKRLQDALIDGDPIQAVIRGSAINQDGRGQGLTAPNAIAQQALISAALEQAGLPPESIRYLEAHGTGTSLGDPIEVMAAAEALCKQRRKDDPLLLGSNKSLFGHQEAAAGAVGLLKTVLAMQHGVLPSQRNFSTPNHHIPWSRLPLRVVDKNQPWPEGKKRAGVSSFGFSGTNSHVIVEEYQAETAGEIINKKKAPVAIILSAKKPDRLLERCTQLLNYLRTHQPDIHDLAYTLQQGRDEMKFRCGFSACTIDEVKEHLQEILTVGLVNGHKEGHFYCGSAKPSSECKGGGSDSVENLDLDSTLTHDDVNQVISEWVCGVEVNWGALYRSEIPHRLSLPTYPFSSDRHWFLNSAQEEKQSNGDIYTFSITPISNSNKNVHTSRAFIGDEWFLNEHVINDSRIMPGAAQLAMIRTVANDYWGDVKTFHLSNIVWLRPIVADSPIEIHVDFISESDEVTRYELYSFVGTERLVYSGGYISPQNTVAPSRVDLANLRDQCQRRIPKREFYEKFDGMGLNYGAGFTVLEEAYAGSNIALGKLSDPITTKNFIWPLNIIDGALQVGLVFLDSDKNSVPMPFALKDMQVWEPIPLSGWVSAVPSSDDTPAVRKLDITVMDESGRVAVRILGFSTRFGKKKTISDPIVYPTSALNSGVQAMNSDHTHSLTALSIIKRTLSGLIAEHLKMPEHELDDETPLSEFGFDSITMTSFSHLLNQRYGLNLNATVLYEAPTIAALAGYLQQEQPAFVASLAADAPQPAAQPASLSASASPTPQSNLTAPARPVTAAAGNPAVSTAVEATLRGLIAEHLKMPEHELDDETPLSEFGFDSITMTSFSHLLNQRYGLNLNATVLYEAPTIAALVGYLQQEQPAFVASLAAEAPQPAAQPASPAASASPTPQANLSEPARPVTAAAGNSAVGMAVEATLRGLIAEHLKMPEHELDDETPLSEFGFDSITMTSFSHLLNQRYGLNLNATVLYEAPTIAALAGYLQQEQPAFVASLAAEGPQTASSAASVSPTLQANLTAPARPVTAAAGNPAVSTAVEATLRGLIAEHLKMPEHELDDETPLSEFGFDSITMTSFSHLLNQRYGLNLNATVLYEAPTIAALAGYLRQEQPGLIASLAATGDLHPPETESAASGLPSPAVSKEGDTHIGPTSAQASYPNNEPIAIIGMSGCFPLSNDIDALWENLLAGRDCIRELPPERWGANPSPVLKHAGVIDGLEFFDPLFFGISPREAKSLDPYQRLLMQTVYNVIEEAGYSVGSLSGSNTALLVATYSSGYRQLQALAGEPVESYSITSIVSSMGPNRMSHWLNWHGPSEPIETACSSSLVGIHRAVQLLRNGECDQAVVGGVNALVTMDMHESLTLAGFLSPTGKCRAFSANVDGYVRSEGAGMLFLKPLAAAERDGDHIYGLIKGSGVNHGGRSSSLTTPNAKAQTDLIERTLRHSGITPDTISYIEAHATGTPVGDPIECKALKDAFTALDDGKINLSHRCGLGSIKSNIGHLEVAAGVAGVIKVLLQLRHRKLVPSINSQPCNPKIDFANSPFYVVTETQDWIAPKDQDGRNLPLRACVNSFGFGGVNAHVIVEEYVSEQDNKSLPESAEPVVLVLSARNEERLRLRAQQLCQVMREGAVDLRALAYTLQVGRDAMKARLAIVVNSQDEAIQKLLSFVSNGCDENNGYYNLLKSLSTHAEKERVLPVYPSDIPALSRLAQSWIQGEMIDWVALYPGKKPRRLSLPTYPFAKVSHWIPEQITNAPAVSPSQPAKLQPGETCSQDYSYAVQITGAESWLGLLRRQDVPQMPCSVQLEWVRSAVCVLMEKETAVTLEQVLWLAPLKATAPQNIHIHFKPEGGGRFRYEIRTENTKDEQTIHGRGLVYQNNPAALVPQPLSITTLRSSNALSVVHGDEYYRRLQQTGIVYSQQAQVTTSYEIGEHCLLGRLSKPKNNDLEGLLARLENGLMLAGLLEKGRGDKALLALSSASFWQPLPDEDVVVWCRPARESNKIMPGWDIQIADDIGNVLIEFSGVTFQPSKPSGDEHPARQKQNAVLPHSDNATELLSAVPYWRTFSANSLDSPWPDSGPSVLWLSHEFEHDDENRLCQRFLLSQELEHLIWEVSPGNAKNAIYGFRLLKSLLAAGWGSKSLKLTLITRQAQALGKHESSDPHQATLFGLMGSASKEYPHWHIRLLDIPLRQSLWFTEWQNLPPDPRGWPQLWRHGKWYQRSLLPCKLASTGTATGFRQHGVVVILGGAGGVGKAFSEYLIRRANTQVIWLGRRAEDATISQYRHDLGRLGPAPLYLQADATDKQQLEHAYAEIISRYGTINGIVHSAIVLADRSLALMDEDTFDTALTAKTLTTINLEAVFGQPTLDFFIFFSSIQSFAIWPGQSNYSAGCYFTDAFAHELRSRPYATKVINWGYWGSVGIVATEKYRASMAKQGIGSVEYEEAMPELERFSVSPIGQMAFAKLSVTLQQSGFAVTSQEHVHITPATHPVSLPHLAKISCPKSIVAHLHAVEDELAYQLWSTLSEMAWMSVPPSVPVCYRAWLNESLRLLRLSGILFEDTAPSVQTQWQRWQEICQRPEINTVLNPQLILLTSTLRRLPEILLGKIPATEVIFPNGGFELVEPIYNGNVIVDAFNAQLGEQVENYIHARLKQDPDATFKILEVGAGTGGASKEVFARLAPYNNNIEEYCFTDLSTAFLLNAQSKYTHSVSGLRTKRLNIEMNPVNQHFDIGAYDIVIASNVVHATRNIQQTLNNIKILLKQNGLLLLNELAKTSLIAHLTFGLLDGWWLSEDKQTRTIGGPGLSSTQWKTHLIQSGFNNVVTSDNDEQALGFQVISANSDGVVVLGGK